MKQKNFSALVKSAGWQLFTLVMFMGALVFIFPFLMLFLTSFKVEKDIFNPFVIPDFTYLVNYKLVFTSPTFFLSLMNTVLICVFTMFFAILFSSMAGYMITRAKERIFKITYFIFVLTLIIPGQSNMVMLYKLGAWMHLINTVPYLVLLYLSGNVAYSSMIYSAFTKTIPKALEEAAFIDGCGRFTTFFRIVFPLLSPATGTVIVTEIFWYWNDFQNPLLYLNGTTTTIMMEIYRFRAIVAAAMATASTQWGPVSAICFVATMPIVIFFILTQKHLIKGLTIGAMKG